MGVVSRFDAYQRRHRWLGVPIAVVYKFVDDQGGYLAALITYYGFLSLFPLLLIFSTVLGFLLPGNPALQQKLIDSALGQFPIIGDQLGSTAQPLRGSGWGLTIGILVALYGGLGVAVAIQNAFNQVWGVPVHRRPDPVRARLRSLLLLGLLGLGVLLTTALSAVVSVGERFGPGLRIGAVVLAVITNAALFVLAFRALTTRKVAIREVLPGSVLAAELNAVLARRLWPRALLTMFAEDGDLTSADRRSYESYASAQQYREAESINVEFDTPDETDDPRPP